MSKFILQLNLPLNFSKFINAWMYVTDLCWLQIIIASTLFGLELL